MATLGDLKTRIATEMVRDDLLDADQLAGQLALHIARAIDHYADEDLPFNAVVATAACTPSAVVMDMPATVRRIDRLTIPALTTELIEVTLAEIDGLDNDRTGQPERYCCFNDQVRLWPIPDAAYLLRFAGLKRIDPPTDDADGTTPWTNAASDLIGARTRMTLYRDQFRDAEGVQMAMGAVQESLDRLKTQTARRLETTLRGPAFYARTPFSIITG